MEVIVGPKRAIGLAWSVIATSPDKRPRGPWKQYMTQRADEQTLAMWYRDGCRHWAVVTGAISGLVILDFDGADGQALAERWGIKPHVRTPSGGYHWYLQHPGWYVQTLNSKAKHALGEMWPGLDIRADGGYALFSGQTMAGSYTWLREPEPDPITSVPHDVAEFLGLLAPRDREPPAQPKRATQYSRSSRIDERLLSQAITKAQRGEGRNNTGFWLAQQLHDNAVDYASAAATMREYQAAVTNVADGHGHNSPYRWEEAERSLASAYAMPQREPWQDRAPRGTAAHARPPISNTTDPDQTCQGGMSGEDGDDLPVIYRHWQLREKLDAVWTVIDQQNADMIAAGVIDGEGPLVMRPGSTILHTLEWIDNGRQAPALTICELCEPQVAGILSRRFNWLGKSRQDGDGAVNPDAQVAKLMLMDSRRKPGVPLPQVSRVASHPILGSDYVLITRPGWHPSEGVWYAPGPALNGMPNISATPTLEQVNKALDLLLEDVLGGFNFCAPSETATALAAIILPTVRRVIDGPTPLHLFEAADQGSGKTLLAEACCLAGTGQDIPPQPFSPRPDESRKMIMATLLAGRPALILDNIDTSRHELDSQELALATTGTTYSDRILGASEMASVPNDLLWCGTGNNVHASKDMARRIVRGRIQRVHNPGNRPARELFKHHPLLAWIRGHQSDITAAILTLVQHWLAAGRPPGLSEIESYESWSHVVGGILTAAGYPHLLGNRADWLQSQGLDDQWGDFVHFWAEAVAAQPTLDSVVTFTAAQLLPVALAHDCLGSVLGHDPSARSQAIALGKALITKRGCVYGPWVINVAKDKHSNVNRYWLSPSEDRR